jgi:hypothetical protein
MINLIKNIDNKVVVSTGQSGSMQFIVYQLGYTYSSSFEDTGSYSSRYNIFNYNPINLELGQFSYVIKKDNTIYEKGLGIVHTSSIELPKYEVNKSKKEKIYYKR